MKKVNGRFLFPLEPQFLKMTKELKEYIDDVIVECFYAVDMELTRKELKKLNAQVRDIAKNTMTDKHQIDSYIDGIIYGITFKK